MDLEKLKGCRLNGRLYSEGAEIVDIGKILDCCAGQMGSGGAGQRHLKAGAVHHSLFSVHSPLLIVHRTASIYRGRGDVPRRPLPRPAYRLPSRSFPVLFFPYS